MKQKILTLFVALLTGLAAWAHDFGVDGIYYKITSSAALTVSVSYEGRSYNDYLNEYSGAVVIPESVTYSGKSYSVTGIGYRAFSHCSGLTSVVIPSSVTWIDSEAFYCCSGLTSVVIPSSVTSIVSETFYGCSGLTSVEIPSSVTSIGTRAFSGCSGLTSVVIPSSVTSIGNDVFYGCSGLTSVVIPSSVTSIGDKAFYGCSGLTSVVIPSSVTSIGDYAFYGCSGLTSVVIPSSVTSIGSSAFSGCSGMTSVVIPNSVTSIGDKAFYGCSGLTSVVIPSSVTSIGDYAFSGCRGMTSVVIPSSVTSIGSSAFDGCSGLTSVVIPSSVTSIGDKAFSGCSGLTSVVIPSSVTSIGDYAFSGCRGMTSVVIPSSVTSIGDKAFYNCSFAKDNFVNNSSRVSSSYWGASIYEQETADGLLIDKNVVVYCRLNATSVVIPSSVTSIGSEAFGSCSGLTSVVIPSSVTKIGDYAFKYCTSLKNLTIEDGSETLSLGYNHRSSNNYYTGEGLFYDCPLESVYLGRSISYNSDMHYGHSPFYNEKSKITELTIGELVTSISDKAFYGCSGLTSVVIPSSVTSIGSSAFSGCSGLTSVVIPSSVTSIGDWAFSDVTKAFFLTNTKPSIGSDAFRGCKVYYTANNDSYGISGTHKVYSLLSSMFEVDGVKYIPTSMSQRTCDMVDVDYSAETVNSAIGPTVKYTNSTGRQYDFKVNKVNMYAAYGCKALSDLTLKNEGEIEESAFCESSATAIDVDNTITTISDYAFSGCSGASEIKLGDRITSIGNSCFYGCSSVENIKLGKKIASVGNSSFYNCSSMVSVELNDELTSIGSDAFENCSKLASLTIPANVTSIASGAFDNCTSIGNLRFEDSETAISLACRFPSVKNIYMGRNVTYSMSNSSPFSDNNNLENVTTSMYVTNVPDYAFYNCKALKDVYLSDGVRTIGTYVFSGDIALANFEVGISVESIGAEAFSDCTALLEFTSHSILPAAVGTEALDDIDKLECTLHVPEGTEDAYMAADQWKEFWIDGDLLPRYKVVATVDPECAGMGTVKGSNGYDKNTTAKLEAIPAENYVFVEWSDGNKQNPRTITVTGATNLTAKFAYRSTAVDDITFNKSQKVIKTIEDGKVIVIKDGVKYDISGRVIK